MHASLSRPLRCPILLACVFALLCLAFLCPALFAQTFAPFAQPTVIPTGNWPAAVYTADVNGDGYPDLIYIDQGAQPNQPSTTHVLLNDGKGNFTQSAALATIGYSLTIINHHHALITAFLVEPREIIYLPRRAPPLPHI